MPAMSGALASESHPSLQEVVEETLAHTEEAHDSLRMEVVIGAELKRPVLLDLHVVDVVHETTVWRITSRIR